MAFWYLRTVFRRQDGVDGADELMALTSLRFVACFMVVMFHYEGALFGSYSLIPFASVGFLGVTFFFVLSGFILCHRYSDVDFSRNELYQFYAARFARVYPAYIISVVLSLPALINAVLYFQDTGQKSIAALLTAGPVLAVAGLQAWLPGAACSVNCPTWSISNEVFFYVCFPLLLRMLRASAVQLAGAACLCWLASTAVFFAVWQVFGGSHQLMATQVTIDMASDLAAQFIKFFPLGHLHEFIVGMLAFHLWKSTRARHGWVLIWSSVVAFYAIWTLHAHIPEILFHNGVSIAVWLPLILGCAGIRRGVLTWPVATFLGRISFSIYLFHIPVLVVVLGYGSSVLGEGAMQNHLGLLLLCWAVTLALSALMHLVIEEPARRVIVRQAKQRFSSRTERVLGAA